MALTARTIDLLNVIRSNASSAYQAYIPAITKEDYIPKVGELLAENPNMQNEFVYSLVHQISFVSIKAMEFTNAYAQFKKGKLEYGKTIEEAFVEMTKGKGFVEEQAENRMFKKYMPSVKTAFHTENWKVMYPISIEEEQLRTAFTSAQGVTDLIARITGAVLTGIEYDEYLLFKYLLIKAVNNNYTAFQCFTSSDTLATYGAKVREVSNKLCFPSNKYNFAGVMNTTPKEKQYLFIDAEFEAQYDVNVLAQAFNMDKAEYVGHRVLVDDWDTFDSDRFTEITADTNFVCPTTAELAVMANVKMIMVDPEFFQIYDTLYKVTDAHIPTGLRWNYFYHTWKVVSMSPFSNIITFGVFTAETAPSAIVVTCTGIDKTNEGTVYSFAFADGNGVSKNAKLLNINSTDIGKLIAKDPLTKKIIVPAKVNGVAQTVQNCAVNLSYLGSTYSGTLIIVAASGQTAIAVGGTFSCAKDS